MISYPVESFGKPLAQVLRDTPVPKGSEVIIKVGSCGVCHSDVHLHDGYFDLGGGQKLDVRTNRPLPFTLGHEIAGVIERAGPDASGAKPGARVAVYPWIGCGSCAACKAGDENLCSPNRHLGISADGGFASHVLVPIMGGDMIPLGQLAKVAIVSTVLALIAFAPFD